MTVSTVETPRVWVGCLACYNAGRLTGSWVDADEAADFVPCEREDFGSPHEEWWVMDHEGYRGLLSGECSPVEAARLAGLIDDAERDGIPPEALAAWCANIGATPDSEELDRFRDAYAGEWDSEEAYAEDWYESSGWLPDLPDGLYVDWERTARDMFHTGFTSSPADGGSVYVWLDR